MVGKKCCIIAFSVYVNHIIAEFYKQLIVYEAADFLIVYVACRQCCDKVAADGMLIYIKADLNPALFTT